MFKLSRAFYLSLVALLGLGGAVAVGNYTMTQGAGTSFGSVVIGGTVHYAQQLLCDLTTPSQCAAVSAGGAVKTDSSATTQPVSGTVTANIGTAGTLATAANQTSQITQETAINTVIGTQADAVCGTATGTCTMAALAKFLNTAATSATPAGTNLIGDVNLRQGGTALSATNGGFQNILQGNAVLSATNGLFNNILQGNAVLSQTNPSWSRSTDGTRAAIIHPCEANVQSYAPISITTATTTQIVAASASNKTYICSLFLTSAAADNVGIVEGTGGTCGTGTAGVIGGTTAANGPNFAANGGVMLQSGGKTSIAQTAGTNVGLCLITSAGTPLAGGINYVQAP
jgi:hypothetical protein